jgi:hypothetical protein
LKKLNFATCDPDATLFEPAIVVFNKLMLVYENDKTQDDERR